MFTQLQSRQSNCTSGGSLHNKFHISAEYRHRVVHAHVDRENWVLINFIRAYVRGLQLQLVVWSEKAHHRTVKEFAESSRLMTQLRDFPFWQQFIRRFRIHCTAYHKPHCSTGLQVLSLSRTTLLIRSSASAPYFTSVAPFVKIEGYGIWNSENFPCLSLLCSLWLPRAYSPYPAPTLAWPGPFFSARRYHYAR